MIIEHSRNAQYLSNTYLVCDHAGGSAVVIDAGGPVEPLFVAADRLSVTPSMVLLTHHHFDHVSEVGELLRRWPSWEVDWDDAKFQLTSTVRGWERLPLLIG